MAAAAFIAGDWGTSHLRLSLCDAQGCVLDTRQGPGVAELKGDFSACFAGLIEAWTQQHGALPAVLCGMVGSNIGWVNVPYLPCPAKPAAIAHAVQRLDKHIMIAPGLACRNPNDAADFMRGEETQVLGVLRLDARLRKGQQLLCLPGTHTKWVVLKDGEVRQFLTAVTGELFAIIKEHSVLVRASTSHDDAGDVSFQRAMQHAMQYPAASLQQLLFECRSRQLDGTLLAEDAAAFLSGLLITTDVMSAVRVFSELIPPTTGITFIGTAQLTQRYAAVCDVHGIRTTQVDGASASLAGLTAIYTELKNT